MVILISILLFLVFFNLITRKYKNQFLLYFIFGKKGSGKSTLLVKLALKYQKKGFIIYSNMPDLKIPNSRYFDVSKLGDFIPEPFSCIVLDEVGMIWDSRNFKAFKDSVRDYFKLQRHYKCVVIMASQTWDIDKKLRDLTDKMYLVTNFATIFSLVRPVHRKLVVTESTSDSESRISENLKISWLFDWRITFIPRYAQYFDSYLVPIKPNLPYEVLYDVSADPDSELLQTQIPLSSKIRALSYIPRHTKNSVFVRSHVFSFLSHFSLYSLIQNCFLTQLIDRALTYFAMHNDSIDNDFDKESIILEFSIYLACFLFLVLAFILLCLFF